MKVEALSAVIISWSALCSIFAPEERRELNYTPFGLIVGGACIAVILFVVFRQKPLCVCLSSCCKRRPTAASKSRPVNKVKKVKHALGSVPLDALAPKDTSVHISSFESNSEDENEGRIDSESEENFDEEKKTDS